MTVGDTVTLPPALMAPTALLIDPDNPENDARNCVLLPLLIVTSSVVKEVIAAGPGMVVVVVVDVVVVEVEVVVVVVVVEVTTVAAVLSMGHEEIAAVGLICSGLITSGTDVVVSDWPGVVVTVVDVCGAMSGMIASASESAGATAGGSL